MFNGLLAWLRYRNVGIAIDTRLRPLGFSLILDLDLTSLGLSRQYRFWHRLLGVSLILDLVFTSPGFSKQYRFSLRLLGVSLILDLDFTPLGFARHLIYSVSASLLTSIWHLGV